MPNPAGAAEEHLIRECYRHFNAREIEEALAGMASNVQWPNGFEGGYVHGHAGVRDYWTRQWLVINPRVEPLGIVHTEGGQLDVDVHQVVRDATTGAMLSDRTVHHVYWLDGGFVTRMEIREA